jgi:hypothetical protein
VATFATALRPSGGRHGAAGRLHFMSKTLLAAAAALLLAVPALAQVPGSPLPTRDGGPVAQQGGPHGSEAGPIAPQLQAAQQSLLNADRQLSASRTGNTPPNYAQARSAVMASEDTLAEMRNATGNAENPLLRDAERQLAEARRLMEASEPNLQQVSQALRNAANAVTTLGSATGATTGGTPAPGQPAMGGGVAR